MSTENKSLKFIHLASGSVAAAGSYDAGSIIFEPKSGRIAVKGATELEYYGGNIKDATFVDKVLTLSFNTGDDITLDFSDTASASGVNAILGRLNDRITTLETAVNGDGTEGSGLVKKVAANATAIQANRADIDAIKDESTGILVTAKGYTDTKISAIKGGAAEGETLKKLRDSITTLEGKHADGKTVAEEIIDKVGTGITGTVESYINTKVTDIDKTTGDLRTDVNALKTAVGKPAAGEGTTATGLYKDIDDLAGLHADKSDGVKMSVAEEVAAGIAKVVDGAPERLDTLKEIADWIGNDTTGAVQMANDIKALKDTVGKPAAGSDAATGLHKDIADNKAAIVNNAAAIADNKADITALKGLHGKDTDDSLMSVAKEADARIAAIKEASVTSDDGTDVKVTVKTAAGSVSDVVVDASGLRDDLGVKTAEAGTDTAFARIKALEGTVGDSNSGLVKKVNDNTSNISANADAIKALQNAQASGSLMWSSWAD